MASTPVIAEMLQRFIALNYPKAPEGDVLDMVVASWEEDLADLTDAELRDACRQYRRSTLPEDRWWPTVGRLIALSPVGKATAHLGSDTDADSAWADFHRRMSHLAGRGGPLRGARELDRDPYRNDAMWAGLAAMGGPRAWDRMDLTDRAPMAKWRAAYIAARVTSRGDLHAVRSAAVTLAPPPVRALLPEAK